MSLATPLGLDAFAQAHLASVRADRDILLSRLPAVPDLQEAWMILSFCARPRPNFYVRFLPPSLHDRAVRACVQKPVGVAGAGAFSQSVAQMPNGLPPDAQRPQPKRGREILGGSRAITP